MRHKGIEMGVLTDAPFIGARINAIDCCHNCPGCFNQHLHQEEIQHQPTREIISAIIDDVISEGIILGGLEWTEQKDDMLELIDAALAVELPVMLFTHHMLEDIKLAFPSLINSGIYVKCGEYIEGQSSYMDVENDVLLAGTNQRIYIL